MRNCCRLLLVVVVAVAGLAGGRAQDLKRPGKEVVDLAREAEAGKDVTKKAAALKNRFASARAAMQLFNPRHRGGIGYGPKGRAIERQFIDLGEKGTGADVLAKEAADLIRAAHVSMVLAEVTRGFAPQKEFLGRGKKEWERDVDAMKAASRSLADAVKAGDPKAVQAAAARVNRACNSCHDGER